MKLLIVTTEKDLSCDRIIKEAKKKGIKVSKILYKNLENLNVGGFDFCILRDPYNTGKDYSGKLRKLLNSFSKVLDSETLKQHPAYEDKLFQHELFGEKINMTKVIEDVKSFPVIVKKKISSRGKGIFIINSKDELDSFFSKHKADDYFIEEFLDIKEDVRVFLIGNEIVGGVKRKVRIKQNGEYKGVGVKVLDKYDIPNSIKEKAILVSKLIKCDFCGIDFLIDKNGNDYLIECNISPQFISSEKVMKINIAKKLIDFILKNQKQ